MGQIDVIVKNKGIIEELREEDYPALVWMLRKKHVQNRLMAIMNHMLSYPCPVWPLPNRKYYLFSMPYLREWAKENIGLGGSPMMWQGNSAFLEDAGLIARIHVTGPSQDPFLNSIWEKSVEKTEERKIQIKAEALWAVKPYTEDLLKEAEKIAEIYKNAQVSLCHYTKTDMERLRGPEVANRIYRDGRHISGKERIVYGMMIEVINQFLDEKGYAKPAEVEETLQRLLEKRLKFTHPDKLRMNEWTDAEMNEYKRERDYKREVKKVMARKNTICRKECGAVYGQATLEQRAKYGLKRQAWIIARTTDTEKQSKHEYRPTE